MGTSESTPLQETKLLWDVDGTLGTPTKNINFDGKFTSASILSWEEAVARFCRERNIPEPQISIWSTELKPLGTDQSRAFAWIDANKIPGSTPIADAQLLIDYRCQSYSELIKKYGPDFNLFPDSIPGLEEIKRAGGQNFLWTGNPKSIAELKAAELLKRGLLDPYESYTGEEPSKVVLLRAAGGVLNLLRVVIVGDAEIDFRSYQNEFNGRSDFGFCRRVSSENYNDPSIILPNQNVDIGIFYRIDDPLFRIIALGNKRIREIFIHKNISAEDIQILDDEVFKKMNIDDMPGTIKSLRNLCNLKIIRPELFDLYKFLFLGGYQRTCQNNMIVDRELYLSTIYDYLFNFLTNSKADNQSALSKKMVMLQTLHGMMGINFALEDFPK